MGLKMNRSWETVPTTNNRTNNSIVCVGLAGESLVTCELLYDGVHDEDDVHYDECDSHEFVQSESDCYEYEVTEEKDKEEDEAKLHVGDQGIVVTLLRFLKQQFFYRFSLADMEIT